MSDAASNKGLLTAPSLGLLSPASEGTCSFRSASMINRFQDPTQEELGMHARRTDPTLSREYQRGLFQLRDIIPVFPCLHGSLEGEQQLLRAGRIVGELLAGQRRIQELAVAWGGPLLGRVQVAETHGPVRKLAPFGKALL